MAAQGLPSGGVGGLGGGGEGIVDPVLPLFRGPGIGAGTHQPEPVGAALRHEPGEPGQQQPAREIAGSAEDEQGFYSCLARHLASMPS